MNIIIEVPKNIGVFEDKKTKVKTLALPFQFPGGVPGAVMITKLKKGDWTAKEIKTITIELND